MGAGSHHWTEDNSALFEWQRLVNTVGKQVRGLLAYIQHNWMKSSMLASIVQALEGRTCHYQP